MTFPPIDTPAINCARHPNPKKRSTRPNRTSGRSKSGRVSVQVLSQKIEELSKKLDELSPQDVVKDWGGLYKLLDDNSNSFGDAVMRTSSVTQSSTTLIRPCLISSRRWARNSNAGQHIGLVAWKDVLLPRLLRPLSGKYPKGFIWLRMQLLHRNCVIASFVRGIFCV